ncbi:MAG: hypothetical protein HGJ95_02050 [Desulfobacteraceae bacterium]|nr:hypothetical protein [Desulfobacteraceae bacterium]
MEIFYILLVLLFITRAFGEVAVRLGQPALVGELLSGIAVGMLIHWFPVRLRQTGTVGTAENAYTEQDRKD